MKCEICNHGEIHEGTTTVTFDRDGMTLVVKDVPAQVCSNCGEDYVDEHGGTRDMRLMSYGFAY
jgi:YgiT-type zinc finger domain-containing protein